MSGQLAGYRLSPQQRRVWALQSGEAAGPYRAWCVLRLEGDLDTAALRSALALLAERHEILRTVYHRLPAVDEPLQVIQESGSVPLAESAGEEASGCPPEIDLARGPILQARLVRLEPSLHRLRLDLPALASDGRSLGHLAADLARCYDGLRAGRAPEELPVQYADLSEWQNEMLESDEAEAARDYWRERSVPGTVLGLPFEAEGEVEDFVPRTVRRTLEEGLAAACDRLAAGWGASPEAFFLAAWQVLLARLTGQDEVTTGVCLDGRRFAELAGAVGLLDRLVPIGGRLDVGLPFQAVLAQASRSLREAAERLEGFAWELWAPGGGFLPAAFEVLEPAPVPTAGGLAFTLEEQGSLHDRSTVKLLCRRSGGTVVLELCHDASRLEGGEAERLLERFAALLGSLAAQPEEPIAGLGLLSEGERRQVLSGFNVSAFPLPAEPLLHELVALQAARTPDRVALVFEGETTPYGELARRTAALADRLRRLGVGPEVRVAVCLDRSPEMVVGLLGVLAAGGAYVPLDAGYPRDRLAFMIEDSRPAVLLTQERWLGVLGGLPEAGPRILCLDAAAEESAAGGDVTASPAPHFFSADRLAYVIYTSGSTGRPKGVMVSHRAIANRLLWMQREFPLDVGDALVQKTPVSFDASIWEIFVPLLAGARLVLARPGGHQDSGYLVRLVQEQEATVLQLVPSMLQVFAEEPGLEECSSLRRVWSGGEALPDALARRLRSRLTASLVNLYGPTEASIDASCWPCDGDSPGAVVPIGRPIANVEIYLLDPRLRPVPLGVPGELHIGGAGLARGYLGRPDLTAERFLPDPFGPRSGDRLFRTGDLARHRPEGVLEFLGRIDQQVKLRGFRIEPGEIEQVLCEHPAVGRAVVVVRPDAAGGGRLVAYAVTAGPAPDTAELRAFLAGRLPDYMVPSAIVLLDELPLTPSGKLDRLRLPDAAAVEEERRHVAPRSLTEQLVAGLWIDVLKRDTVGADDNFFELGGNSLVATQLTARLRKVLQVELPIRALFEAPTLRGLSARVEAALTGGGAHRPPIVPAPRSGPQPLSFAQQRLWFLDRLEPGGAAYNLPLSVRLQGPLDVAALAAAFSEITRRHETLRTTFAEEGGRPVQIIGPAAAVVLPGIDLAGLAEEAREAELRRLTHREARRPFDLARGPMLRVLLVRLAGEDHAALVTLHHIVSDGWSMGILVRELTELYRAFTHRLPSPLPALPIQYADFAIWQRTWLDGEVLAAQVDWWSRQLAGIPPLLELPADRPRPALRSGRGGRSALRLPPGLAEALEALGRREGGTMFMTLLAAFEAWLCRNTGQPDLVVGTPIANRNQAEVEDLIGFFVNTLVLRTDVSGDPPFRELLGRVREVSLGASAHQDLPFERLVETLQPGRNLSHTPLFQTLFVFQNAPLAPAATGDLRLIPLDPHSGTSKFDLTLETFVVGRRLGGVIEYSTDLFDEATISRLAGGFATLLQGAAADPGRRLSELPLLAESERRMLLGTRETAPLEDLVERFEQRAAEQADALAVVDGEESLTYGELDRRANRLARHLAGRGAGPESLVCLCLDRSLDLVVAILGVLKAGAAYVPLDPSSPEERLRRLIEDTAAPVVVTRGTLLGNTAVPAGSRVVRLDDEGEAIARQSGEPPRRAVPADAAAYVIFTSGSTGAPKGVVVPRSNVVRLFTATDRWFAFGPSDVWTLFHSYAFDFSVWELWGALLYGGRLVIVPQDTARSPEAFHELLRRERVTVLNQTPSAFRQLQQADGGAPEGDGSLRLVIFGGEALEPGSLHPWFARHGDERPRLVNMYGITETTVHVTYRPLGARDAGAGSRIGVPIADLSLLVLDRYGQLAPMGAPGEIHVAGAGLARGYLNRPELTAERFVPSPFGTAPGERLYRSGDLARVRPGGDVEYLGRIDNQVKVRGFRIELGEVEAALAQHPGVREAVVTARADGPGETRLIGYVVPAPGQAPGPEELGRFLRERLPDYMVPAVLMPLDALPLTPNGKVDRRALPAPSGARPDLGTEYVPPGSPLEEALAASWAEVLGVERVGIDDNFFVIGGDSMRIIQAISQAQRRGVTFSVQQLYQQQTIRELAQVAVLYTPSAAEGPPPQDEDDAGLELLLAELDNLSEEEVRARLQERMPGTGLDKVSA